MTEDTITNPLLHDHMWGAWSVWTALPDTPYQYRLRACTDPGCFMINMEKDVWTQSRVHHHEVMGRAPRRVSSHLGENPEAPSQGPEDASGPSTDEPTGTP